MRKIWYVLLVLTLFVLQGTFLSAVDNPPKPAAKLLEKAEKALKDNELDKALENYNKALELAPEYGPIYYGIARVQMAQKKTDDAIASLEKALQYAPDSTDIKQFYAKCLFNGGREAFAQQVASKAKDLFAKISTIAGIAELEPKIYVESLYQAGSLCSGQQEFDKSNGFLIKLLETPNIATTDAKLVFFVNYQVGINYYSMQKNAESITYMEKALAIPGADTFNNKAFATAHYIIGLNASQLKDYAKSNEYLTKFTELNKIEANANPQLEPLAQYILGSNLMASLDEEVQKIRDDANEKRDKKKDIEALAVKSPAIETYLAKAIELKPDLEPAYMSLGNYYYYLGKMDKAITTYKTLIEKFPNSPDIDAYKKFLTSMEKPVEAPKAEPKKKK